MYYRVISILKESLVTHVTVGALTSDPLHRRRELYLKSYLDSLLLAIRYLYLGRNGRPPQYRIKDK